MNACTRNPSTSVSIIYIFILRKKLKSHKGQYYHRIIMGRSLLIFPLRVVFLFDEHFITTTAGLRAGRSGF
jgi:hypothetical protein